MAVFELIGLIEIFDRLSQLLASTAREFIRGQFTILLITSIVKNFTELPTYYLLLIT